MKIQEIIELSGQVFQANKEKGFWDDERTAGECLALICSEMYEALEADRKGQKANQGFGGSFNDTPRIQTYKLLSYDCPFHAENFKDYIKDTKEDELSDVLIRIMDLWGSQRFYELGDVEAYFQKAFEDFTNEMSPAFMLLQKYKDSFVSFVYNMSKSMPLEEMVSVGEAGSLVALCHVFIAVWGYCESMNIDIRFHILEKLKYNKTRAFKHGKKY